jgi:beta-glucosidase
MAHSLFVVILLSLSLKMFGQTASDPWAEHRAKDLVSRMTLEEKVLQMQTGAPAVPRLGIPAYDWWNEGLHGVGHAGEATVFPQAIGMAATWDTDLMHRVADAISTEARAKYNEAIRQNDHSRYHGLTFWSPNINIFRDPRWVRGQETYGEDPYLTSRVAVAFIKGLQGDDPKYFKVIATAGHFAVHSGPDSSRHQAEVEVSERDLKETYLPAFRASIMEGKADSVMCASNSVDGMPACANSDLLQKYLRGEWGFQGYVVSDCGAITDIFKAHKYEPDAATASAVAVKTGTDLTCGTEYKALVQAVKTSQITEAEINKSVERLFTARYKLGMFDPPELVPYSKIPYLETDSAEHRKLALEAARKSIVLLKNENQTLPLKASIQKIAVIGPSADDPDAMLGNHNGFSSKEVTPLEGIQSQFAAASVRFALGATYTGQSQALIPSEALTSPNGASHGLLAEYFDNPDFQGQPKLQRVESRPYLQAGIVGPGRSVRWTGMLTAPFTGDYVIASEGGRVFVDDKDPAHIELESGHSYKLRVEFRPEASAASLRLEWTPPAEPLLAEALDAVRHSDVVIALVGLNPNPEGAEDGDRTDLNLPAPQEKLIHAAIETGKPVVVVLTSGGALAANYAAEHAAALLEAWYGGEEAGTAIAQTLAGVNNPSGRLPVTFYRGVDQLPPFEEYAMKGRTYRYFKGTALYGFGFGLSYSKFEYSQLHTIRTPTGGRVSVRVKNASLREGDEVVELYVGGGEEDDDPIRQLRGFQRIHLRPNETRTVEFTIAPEDLPADKAKISVGGGQPIPPISYVEGMF